MQFPENSLFTSQHKVLTEVLKRAMVECQCFLSEVICNVFWGGEEGGGELQ